MGKLNSKQLSSSDVIGPQSELLRNARASEQERVLGDISIRLEKSGRTTVTFEPKELVLDINYLKKPTEFDPRAMVESLRSKGVVTLNNVAYAGGTVLVVGSADGSSYMVTVMRDSGAPTYPNTLDSLSGRGNSANPYVSIIGEAVGEVMPKDDKKRVVKPQLSQTELKAYNGYVDRMMNDLVEKLSAETNTRVGTVSVEARMGRINNPSYLDGIPVAIGFAPAVDWDMKASIFDIMLPPLMLNRIPIGSFKETIEWETDGKVPERQVVLLKIHNGSDHSPEVMAYHKGRKMGEWRSLERYSIEMGIDPERPFTPNAATIAQHIGVDFGHDSGSYMPTLAALLRD